MVKVTVVDYNGKEFMAEGVGCLVCVDKGETTSTVISGHVSNALIFNAIINISRVIEMSRDNDDDDDDFDECDDDE